MTVSFRRVTLVLTALLTLSAAASAEEQATGKKWAVVATAEVTETGFPDLLMARLSKFDGVQLVERQQIGKVLDELNLNASTVQSPPLSGKWTRRELLPLFQWLAGHDDPIIRMCGNYNISITDDGVPGAEAAEAILDTLWNGLPENLALAELQARAFLGRAAHQLAIASQLDDYFVGKLHQMETAGDLTPLVRTPALFDTCLGPVTRTSRNRGASG